MAGKSPLSAIGAQIETLRVMAAESERAEAGAAVTRNPGPGRHIDFTFSALQNSAQKGGSAIADPATR